MKKSSEKKLKRVASDEALVTEMGYMAGAVYDEKNDKNEIQGTGKIAEGRMGKKRKKTERKMFLLLAEHSVVGSFTCLWGS